MELDYLSGLLRTIQGEREPMAKAKKKVVKKKPPALSALPSKAIRQAIRDLTRVEKSKNYIVDMTNWHEPIGEQYEKGGKPTALCSVCLAGAVMSRITKDPKKDVTPGCFDGIIVKTDSPHGIQLSELLLGLDEFRKGYIAAGLDRFERNLPWGLPEDVDIQAYEVDAGQFKKDMLALADLLEKFGH
jgi:hypothetical protein